MEFEFAENDGAAEKADVPNHVDEIDDDFSQFRSPDAWLSPKSATAKAQMQAPLAFAEIHMEA